ncbi:MAG: cobaltochelatase subunit CobN, partial [Pseudomonadota bacterium]
RIALIFANYPNRDGRMANGVGLDAPAAMANALTAMAAAGYAISDAPRDGAGLMAALKAGPTNAIEGGLDGGAALPLAAYREGFAALPPAAQAAVAAEWGAPEDDPFCADGAFRLAIHRWGNIVIGLQPSRGYDRDPKDRYHDPALAPPHRYIAFHIWLRASFDAHALVQMGKHGNLEWLPGKALALSAECWPEMLRGPVPVLYPFIVNDPGEGAQAKRRLGAAVVDHLTPPLARAGSYGPLAELEALADEYAEAAALDPRRLPKLRGDLRDLAARTGLDADCGFTPGEPDESALAKIDARLCEIKETQIRDGLHVFGV